MASGEPALILNAQAAGEIEFLRVLTARRVFFDVNLKYVSALVELSQANAEIEGLLLTGGLSNTVSFDGGDDLRGQALSGQ
jgi:cobalt-zinc-cadmium efflux system outer membrane protein